MTITTPHRLAALAFVAALAAGACSSTGSSAAPTAAPTSAATAAPASAPVSASTAPASAAALAGTVNIDGSSTVYPITEAVAEEFQKANPGVKVTGRVAGTGGGFKKFCAGETDMNDASRPIKAASTERAREVGRVACKAAGIDYAELGIAIDGLTVLVNPQNTWVDCLTTAELKTIWDAGSTVKTGPTSELPGQPTRSVVRPGCRLRDIRLLHRGDQRQGRSIDPTPRSPRTTTSW